MFLSTLENFQLLWKDFGQSGKFLNNQRKFPAILKTFWTPWKVFTYYRMFPDPLESFLTQKNFWTPNSFMKIWKESGHSRKFPKTLRVFGKSRKFLGTLKSFWTIWKVSGYFSKFQDVLESFRTFPIGCPESFCTSKYAIWNLFSFSVCVGGDHRGKHWAVPINTWQTTDTVRWLGQDQYRGQRSQ